MIVTLLGMVTLVRLVHPENVLFSILFTLLGMVILVRLVQLENA
jgi:hypothetical protein